MRLHHLRVEAFGPFAAPVDVDFDELSDAGLFLLSGATGAGKTSVLDAVCFALYGDVPGDRGTAKRLRCDQAAPGAVPRVDLEVTLSGRRFRFVRSPAWERPKKRGAGTTTEPAKVTVSELVAGSWQPLSSRLDETGDLVSRVVGLTQTQFTQVAMLPQGRFQAFLRARSDDRHRLLQQLFRTGRFEAVERWLRERRTELARADTVEHQRVADVVSRASEVADAGLPSGTDLHDLTPALDDGTLRSWLVDLVATAEGSSTEARAVVAEATGHEVGARQVLELARADHERRELHVATRHEHAELLARSDRHDEDRARLDAARRAATVVPSHRQATTAAERADRAGTALVAAQDHLSRHLGRPVDPDRLGGVADDALAATAVATALRPRVARLDVLREQVASSARRRTHLATDLDRVQHELAVRPDALHTLQAQVLTVEQTADQVDDLTAAAQEARSRLDAHELAVTLAPQAAAAREQWLEARGHTLQLRDQLVAVRMARIDGMAAELALALAVGASCPVCGSGHHPAKARPAAGAPDGSAEKAATAAVDDAAVVEHALDQQVRDLDHALAAARAGAGDGSAAELVERLATRQHQLSEALRAVGLLPDLRARLAADRRSLDELDQRSAALLADLARTGAEHERHTVELDGLAAEVDHAVGAHTDLEALLTHHRQTAHLAREAARAHDEACEAVSALATARDTVDRVAREAGFDDADSAVAVALDAQTTARLADGVERHERRLAALTEVLRRSAPLDDRPLPDVEALAAAHDEALGRLRTAGARLALHRSRLERLGALLGELDGALVAWEPLRRELDLTTRLSAFVEGRSGDNLLRMRLSAYVLAYRLSQVVDAANERLARMSDQRYSLEHTGQRGAGETRGGLSLLVRDDWSGESRDPATLSGGETFVVSLALALGLADVIAHEAGGAALDTLFVDEGFGSLDADTLDDVMDTLDALRDGGRVVGVVSHVAEMRDRIPTQLVVTKSREGSSVSLRG